MVKLCACIVHCRVLSSLREFFIARISEAILILFSTYNFSAISKMALQGYNYLVEINVVRTVLQLSLATFSMKEVFIIL